MGSFDKFLAGLGKQEERTVDKIKVEKNPVLEELVKIYAGWIDEKSLIWADAYQLSVTKTKHLAYSSKDISGLCLRLKDHEQHDQFELSGVFLSGLINNCKNDEFLLMTDHLDKQIDCIGYENTKKIVVQGNTQNFTGNGMCGGSITVQGNTKNWTGWEMRGGSIIVTGNTGNDTGCNMHGGNIAVKGNTKNLTGYCMSGGSITVRGNTRNCTGWGMSDGSITIQGNTGQYTGSCMTGGIIKVSGTIQQISEYWKGGKIYEKDKLVFPDRV